MDRNSIDLYRCWIIEMFHKYGHDEFSSLIVNLGEEELLKSVLESIT